MSVVTASPMRLPLHWLVGSKNYMMVSKTYMTTFSLWVIMLSSLAHVPIELSCPVWISTHIWSHAHIHRSTMFPVGTICRVQLENKSRYKSLVVFAYMNKF